MSVPPPCWVLDLPLATPSLNAFVNRRDPFAYTRVRRAWERHLTRAWYAARGSRSVLPGPFVPPARARLSVQRFAPQPIDQDNLVGGLKPVIDSLRRLALIADDAPAVLALAVRATQAPRAGTRLVLTPWPEDAA